MNRMLFTVAVGALACLGAVRGVQAQVVISLEGACPGTLHVRWEGASPNQRAALMFSQNLGQYRLPAGVCEGTVIGLGTQGLHVVRFFVTGPDGEGELSGRATPHACGGYLQMIEYPSLPCLLSNVAQIPE